MEFFALLDERRSIRAFSGKKVDESLLNRILDAASKAPSAGNLQAYRIAVVKGKRKLSALAEAAFGQGFISDAAFALVFLADAERSAERYGNRGSELYSVQDATIACAYAQLAVADLGLGSAWVGAFNPEAVVRAIGVKGGSLMPIAILPVGYSAEIPTQRKKKGAKKLMV